jgi:hypothetical protein
MFASTPVLFISNVTLNTIIVATVLYVVTKSSTFQKFVPFPSSGKQLLSVYGQWFENSCA